MSVRRLPDLDLIREAWTLGYSYVEISEKFGISVAQAARLVHEKCGYAQQYYWTRAEFDRWKNLYESEHWTYKEIADEYECSVSTVRYHLARLGARLRRRGWSPKKDAVRNRTKARKRATG